MRYQEHYDRLIERARNRDLPKPYERHHAVPKCMGGNNDKSNIVKLTPEEHYVAHQLLVKIYPEQPKLAYAALMMTRCSTGQFRNNKLYGWLRKQVGVAASKRFKGIKRAPFTPEHCANIAAAKVGMIRTEKAIESQRAKMLGRTSWKKGKTFEDIYTPERAAEIIELQKKGGYAGKGKTLSTETKKKLREVNIGKKLSDETKQKLKIAAVGRYVSCLHCRKELKLNTFNIYHNGRC